MGLPSATSCVLGVIQIQKVLLYELSAVVILWAQTAAVVVLLLAEGKSACDC